MALKSRIVGVLAGVLVVAAVGILPSLAQDPAKEKAVPDSAKSVRRLPRYFGQIGLTAEQKEKVYEQRGKHTTRVDELKKQLADEQAKELADCESVLLEPQKKVLVQLRADAKEKTAARSKARAKTAAGQAKDAPENKAGVTTDK